ncbi:MAG: PocR ligand-binding domain-containing protein [Gammaproteobacteria bacterium]|nr:PocR ligand-binding domain-containing protein [Gammaproteobacteria bacterium]
MIHITRWVYEQSKLALLLTTLIAVLLGWGATLELRHTEQMAELNQLQTVVERHSIEVMSQTLNGNLMGAMAVLGLIDPAVKLEAQGELPPNNPVVLATLESIAHAYDADGVFVVNRQGVATTSWDNSGKPSTGLKLQFRPYFQMAMQGMDNIYAAVSIARGDRSLYFSAPIFATTRRDSQTIGAVVARTSLVNLDGFIYDKADITLLLSPQGVVFSSSRSEWTGYLAGTPSVERLRAIRELKQFGKIFDEKEPLPLPVEITPGITHFENRSFAVATTDLQWNDPSGEWKLVLMKDIEQVLTRGEQIRTGAITAFIVLLIGSLILKALQNIHRQAIASQQLALYAKVQESNATHKENLAAAGIQLQRSQDLQQLAQRFLQETHHLFGALQGVIYHMNGQDSRLKLIGHYACAKQPIAFITPGEGLLGQCVIERRRQIITLETGHFAMIYSGLGACAPTAILIAPVLLNDHLLGVVELAFLSLPDENGQAQFDELMGLLAMNIEILNRTIHTEEILLATQAAEQLGAAQLAFQQALVDTIPYPVFYKDADTRFLGFNRAYEEAFNIKRADLIGKRVLELDYLPEADRVAYQREDEAMIANADSIQREVQIPFADGKFHDVLYYVSGFRRPDGTPGGLVGTFIDISALKRAEREMDRMADIERFNRLSQGREGRILELKREVNALAKLAGQPAPYHTERVEPIGDHDLLTHPDYRNDLTGKEQTLQLADLVNLEELQRLFSSFCQTIGLPAAIIDLEGKVLASSPWQRACTHFHRVNPESCARCLESDTELSLKLQDGQDFTMYQCKNGMTDCASPIIVEGHHLANVFIGQFHLAPPDDTFFRTQAARFDYEAEDYLKAVDEAPVMDEQRLPAILSFLTGFARMISTMSLARRRADAAQQALKAQAVLLKHERLAALSLAEDAEQARIALEAIATESPS